MGRVLIAFLVSLGLATVSTAALARQDDSRLDILFGQLQHAPSPQLAHLLELQIWSIWTESRSDTIDLLMQSGSLALQRQQFDKALDAFNHVIEIDPEFAEAWNKRATLHYMTGAYPESIADIKRTLALEPRHFGALSGLGLIYDAMEEREQALDAYRRALEVNPHLGHAKSRVEELIDEVEGRGI
ncbi:tetratricopeptide repeat protein [Oceanibacterium hippocampi]|uniref:Lipoprotein NlpI n=1 Tax=Oceanibacterium hippocampi TaxID=745714 RepID=A0A1Y5S914_9PROT|nr:tetratricopeptide repeat protein [Oceanibacterium hippocampi]SLN35226.1 lipoprotein NlpI [Oceanibacterium hippocampi]